MTWMCDSSIRSAVWASACRAVQAASGVAGQQCSQPKSVSCVWSSTIVLSYRAECLPSGRRTIGAPRDTCPFAAFDRAVLKAFPEVAVRPSTLALQ